MSVASKNPYDLLGNDAEDSDAPAAPVKTVEKTSTHTAKRNSDGLAPASKAPAAPTGNRRGGGASGNEAAFRDRNAGSDRNRVKPTDVGAPRGRGRGGRGGRNPRSDDRHSKSLPSGGSEKQAALSWGATEGQAELKDEQAGEEIAQTEQKEATAEGDAAPAEAEAKEEEPEDKHISYADYLAQQAEKKAALEAENALKVRKANEGIKEDKKWANAKPLAKEEGEDYFAGAGGKAKRERERKQKQVLEIDQRYVEPERTGGGRGGRGGPRGGRGEGGRGRGRGAPRGEYRGDNFRGGRGGRGAGNTSGPLLNPSDESAFPSLGS
ncbi:Stm1-domain-containing protein [Diplogelasinospora grovesii]|uniref:Stm1-domain-containing protein n=1 Tax=Diplogelasinospora grovesii TaxID=303347 RepID=A0AAN6S774_9PEZI|nr:Stm1-domain-containing protein [Diplogelasinospora grovesii]